MRYAIISDIHGNLPAFEAVLRDAEKMGVDEYILLGDYAVCLPWGNEVVDRIRNLKPAYIIKGNQEDYLINVSKQGNVEWDREKSRPIHYAYNSLTQENRDFLFGLPDEIEIVDNHIRINIVHDSRIFYRSPRIEIFHCHNFRSLYEENPDIANNYDELTREAILTHPEASKEIEALPEGIYIFAHNHLQFQMEYKGRYFINPGSASIPLDSNNNLSYAVLDVSDSGVNIDNRRVAYDYRKVIKMLLDSEYYQYAPFWCQLVIKEIETGLEYLAPFLLHLEEYNDEFCEPGKPISNEIWNMAVKAWKI